MVSVAVRLLIVGKVKEWILHRYDPVPWTASLSEIFHVYVCVRDADGGVLV